MKRYLITSKKYTGTAEVFYNNEGTLVIINCKDTDMDAEIIRSFKRAVPATVPELLESKSFGPDTMIVEAGYRISFEEFWKKYNKKINKYRVIPIYDKLTDTETIECSEGIKPYDTFLERVKARQKLDPENWLKQKSWENDWRNA
jgi:hypothetical protein